MKPTIPIQLSEITLTDKDLLDLYLASSTSERMKIFLDTEQAAQWTGLSRRTIQFWIETGAVRAIAIGRRYEVYLPTLTSYLQTRMEGKSAGYD